MSKTIKEYRELKGWTQQELADRVGAGRSYLCRVENGELGPSLELLQALAREFGCACQDLTVARRRPSGGQRKPASELVKPFLCPPPLPPEPECTGMGRLGAVRSLLPGWSINGLVRKHEEFLNTVSAESGGETACHLRELDRGALTTSVTVHSLGFDLFPVVCWKTGRPLGHCRMPAIVTADWLMVPQVGIQTPRRRYRMDGLIVVLHPRRIFVDWEFDGTGHNHKWDGDRNRDISLPVIRVREEDLKTDPGITHHLRKMGLCRPAA